MSGPTWSSKLICAFHDCHTHSKFGLDAHALKLDVLLGVVDERSERREELCVIACRISIINRRRV